MAGCCRELVAGGALFILLIYSLVCCWLELQAGLGASASSGTCLCRPRACLAQGICTGGWGQAPCPTRDTAVGSSLGCSLIAQQQQGHHLPCVQQPVEFEGPGARPPKELRARSARA